jgi:hypothetical protein
MKRFRTTTSTLFHSPTSSPFTYFFASFFSSPFFSFIFLATFFFSFSFYASCSSIFSFISAKPATQEVPLQFVRMPIPCC